MLKPAIDSKREAAAHARPELRAFRPDNPYVALGLAVNHLMTKPAFAALRFGEWSRILVGQINRKHYYFVLDAKNQVQGFLGTGTAPSNRSCRRCCRGPEIAPSALPGSQWVNLLDGWQAVDRRSGSLSRC
jgi:hypothetical protein